jgi:hypothetical protein
MMALSMTARLLICCAFVRFFLPCHFDFDFGFFFWDHRHWWGLLGHLGRLTGDFRLR